MGLGLDFSQAEEEEAEQLDLHRKNFWQTELKLILKTRLKPGAPQLARRKRKETRKRQGMYSV